MSQSVRQDSKRPGCLIWRGSTFVFLSQRKRAGGHPSHALARSMAAQGHSDHLPDGLSGNAGKAAIGGGMVLDQLIVHRLVPEDDADEARA